MDCVRPKFVEWLRKRVCADWNFLRGAKTRQQQIKSIQSLFSICVIFFVFFFLVFFLVLINFSALKRNSFQIWLDLKLRAADRHVFSFQKKRNNKFRKKKKQLAKIMFAARRSFEGALRSIIWLWNQIGIKSSNSWPAYVRYRHVKCGRCKFQMLSTISNSKKT